MKILKLEPFSGVSGDMFLGALCKITGAFDLLRKLPETLGLPGVEIQLQKVERGQITCNKVNISYPEQNEHRHMYQISEIINGSHLDRKIKDMSLGIFKLLAEAEAEVHGTTVDKVHFHEVGAVDAIIDIVGASLLLSLIDYDRVISSPICTGSGTVDCSHGRMPVPAPATEILLRGMPCYASDIKTELTTPTGASILKFLNPDFENIPVAIEKTGYGAGDKDFEVQANCVRVSVGNSFSDKESANKVHSDETIWVIHANIDDMVGEYLGEDLQKTLFAGGAFEVNLQAVQMKKSRPGVKLEVLCHEDNLKYLIDLVLEETSTIGVRYFRAHRSILPRFIQLLDTPLGPIKFKCVKTPSGSTRRTPEYEDCKRVALEKGMKRQDVYSVALGVSKTI